MFQEIISHNIWKGEYFGNTLLEYFVFALAFFFLFLIFWAVKQILLFKIKKLLREKDIAVLLTEILTKIRPRFYGFIAFYMALSAIDVLRALIEGGRFILLIWIAYRVIVAGQQFIDFATEKYLKRQGEKGSRAMVRNLGKLGKIVLWTFVFLAVLSTAGIDITALIAGLGIGGVAIAFALQNILSDLFSSFSIWMDKPFMEGDFIIIGDTMGTVKKIGIKSTRLESLHGEEIIVSNRELTSVRVHNYRKMEHRRANFELGLTYDTSAEKLEKAISIIKQIIEKEEMTDFDRAHFHEFGDFALKLAVVYYVKSSDYVVFMDVHQNILLSVKRAFEKEGIQIAFPTQTIHLRK